MCYDRFLQISKPICVYAYVRVCVFVYVHVRVRVYITIAPSSRRPWGSTDDYWTSPPYPPRRFIPRHE